MAAALSFIRMHASLDIRQRRRFNFLNGGDGRFDSDCFVCCFALLFPLFSEESIKQKFFHRLCVVVVATPKIDLDARSGSTTTKKSVTQCVRL